MNNISITYKTNLLSLEKEQAAGFPPFTKGYHSIFKKIQLATSTPDNCITFSFTESSVVQLFEKLHTMELTNSINLKCTFSGKVNQLAYIVVLRTLLCLYLKQKNKDFNQIQFVFYANSETPSLLSLHLAQAIGIDYFFTKNTEQITTIHKHISSQPVDPLYGNNTLKTKIERLFFNLKQKLDHFFF